MHLCSISTGSLGVVPLCSPGWRTSPLGSVLIMRAECTVTVSLSLWVSWKAGHFWHFLSCGSMCLDFTAMDPLSSMKAVFLFPARRAGSLIHQIFWVCWIQLKSASAESISGEQAALEKGLLKILFVSDSCWHPGSGEDRESAKAPTQPNYAVK